MVAERGDNLLIRLWQLVRAFQHEQFRRRRHDADIKRSGSGAFGKLQKHAGLIRDARVVQCVVIQAQQRDKRMIRAALPPVTLLKPLG